MGKRNAKSKRTISKGCERIIEESKPKAPRTPADWRDLEWKLKAAQAKEDALLSPYSDTVSPDYSKAANAALMIAAHETKQLRKVIIETPAADVRALRFKLDVFDPDFDDCWPMIKADALRSVEALSKEGRVTLMASPPVRPDAVS